MSGPLQVLDLFSGLGGFTLAAERIRQRDGSPAFQTVAFCEIDKFARKVLAKHWPEVPCFEDIQELQPSSLHGRGIGRIDVLAFGFPCTDLSVAGKRVGLGGMQSGLFWQAIRLARFLKPAWLVVENVPGLRSASSGRDMARVVGAFAELGYLGAWRSLDARFAGLAQRRERVFFIAGVGAAGCRAIQLITESGQRYPAPRRKAGQGVAVPVIKGAAIGRQPQNGPQRGDWVNDGTSFTLNTAEVHAVTTVPECARALMSPRAGQRYDGESETFIVEDAARPLLGLPNSGHREDMETFAGGGRMEAVAFAVRGREEGARVEAQEGQAFAIRTPTGGSSQQKIATPDAWVRRLTPTECEFLQGVPISHTCLCGQNEGRSWHPDGAEYACRCADGPRYRILGNGLALPCAEWVLRCVAEAHFYEEVQP